MAEGADPPDSVEVRLDLRRCEDLLDLLDESRQLAGELGILVRDLEEIEELLTDQVSDRLLETEGLADVAGGLALLDPDLVELDHWGSADSIPPGDGPGPHGDSPE